MIEGNIHKSPRIQSNGRFQVLFSLTNSGVIVCKTINCAMKLYPFLNRQRLVVLLFSFDKIADHITHYNFGLIEGKIRVG